MRGRPTDAEVLAAQELASRVERSTGSLSMPLNDLLASFGVQRLTTPQRERLGNAFDSAGLTAEPSLLLARRGETVVITQRGSAEAPSPQRPRSVLTRWTSHFGGGAKWLVGALLACVVGALFVHYVDVDRFADRAEWVVAHQTLTGTPSSCKDTGWLRRIEVAGASAFYELDAHPASHSSDDAGRATAWRQVFRGNRKDFIAWALSENAAETRRVRLICVMNGWARNIVTYQDTGRVHKLRVVGLRDERPVATSGCKRTRTLKDAKPNRFGELTSIRFDCDASKIKLTILSTYRGRSVTNDVAISEARFYE